jgi:hypothetical protein
MQRQDCLSDNTYALLARPANNSCAFVPLYASFIGQLQFICFYSGACEIVRALREHEKRPGKKCILFFVCLNVTFTR